ncbi:MAG TPA: type IV pilus assembly protein PilM [Kineosporiaceae bacterium]
MAARTAIGLDVGTSVVRAVELSYGRAGITLERFGQVVLPPDVVHDGEVMQPEPVIACLRELWRATGFRHTKVVLGVANQRVIVRRVELPWMEVSELRDSLAFHVSEFLPMEVSDSVLDFFPLSETTGPEGARMLSGLLVAASRAMVLANVRCAEQAGLSVRSVDLTSFAVLRSLGRQQGVDVDTEALIDVGARITNIVVHQAGVPLFVRILPMGGQDVTDAVASALGVPMPQAEAMKQQFTHAAESESEVLKQTVGATVQDFVDEVSNSLDYFAATNPSIKVQRLLVTGGGSRLEGLLDRLGAEVRLPVVAGDPMANLRIGDTGLGRAQLDFVRPLSAVPVGLAMGGIR